MARTTAPELVFTTRGVKGGGNFPDGNLSFRWPPLVGRNHPILYGSDGGVMATLDIPNVYHRCQPIAGLPPQYAYAGGGGAIITNPVDGSWLGIIHAEVHPAGSPQFFWGNIILARSTDYGQSWTYLGCIVEPSLRYSDPMGHVGEISDGTTALVGDYYYLYYRETGQDGAGYTCVAYVRAMDLFAAAAAGRAAPWQKWTGGPIPNPADPPAVGGGMGLQLPGLPRESDWLSVAYVADRRSLYAAVCPFATKVIGLYSSTDGLSWTFEGPITQGQPGYHYYPSLIGLNPDERFIVVDNNGMADTGYLWLYYVATDSDPFQWANARVMRQKVYV